MTTAPDPLFTPLQIRGHVLRNRIFSTGHMAVMLDDGKISDRMVAYHTAKAKGGAALTIVEAARAHASRYAAVCDGSGTSSIPKHVDGTRLQTPRHRECNLALTFYCLS